MNYPAWQIKPEKPAGGKGSWRQPAAVFCCAGCWQLAAVPTGKPPGSFWTRNRTFPTRFCCAIWTKRWPVLNRPWRQKSRSLSMATTMWTASPPRPSSMSVCPAREPMCAASSPPAAVDTVLTRQALDALKQKGFALVITGGQRHFGSGRSCLCPGTGTGSGYYRPPPARRPAARSGGGGGPQTGGRWKARSRTCAVREWLSSCVQHWKAVIPQNCWKCMASLWRWARWPM